MKAYLKLSAATLCLFLGSFLTVGAQTAKGGKGKTHQVEENKLFTQMLSGTAKVMFIDSIVVDKDSFIHHIPLNKESGSLTFDKEGKVVYTNEFATRQLLAATDSTGDGIYAQERIGLTFTKPLLQESLSEGLRASSYPFLMTDGMTIFFSAEGEKSMGGRDIFMTRYDTEEGKYYKPENEGLPFNSTANDYLIAIDEMDTLGWLVTDRRQPEGKVCIYTFEPTQQRNGFENDDFTDAQIKSFAELSSIKDTWQFGDRDAAMERLKALRKRFTREGSHQGICFVVNDHSVYHHLSDFHSPTARKQYAQLLDMRRVLQKNEEQVAKWRKEYAHNHLLGSSIRKAEKTLQKQRHDLLQFEKNIRNLENKQ